MKIFTVLISCFIIFSCNNKNTKNEAVAIDYTDELYGLMQGSYTSEIQSQQDSTYYNISLHMYPIWKDKGHYLYVEQALNEMQEKPYRQRVYVISKVNDSIYGSAVYELPNDSLWIGKWKTPEAFNSINPEDLVAREGCTVFLERLGANHYKGSTNEQDCKSTLRGAAYASSKVEIGAGKIESWDQGFDESRNQVWGAEKGGYVFIE